MRTGKQNFSNRYLIDLALDVLQGRKKLSDIEKIFINRGDYYNWLNIYYNPLVEILEADRLFKLSANSAVTARIRADIFKKEIYQLHGIINNIIKPSFNALVNKTDEYQKKILGVYELAVSWENLGSTRNIETWDDAKQRIIDIGSTATNIIFSGQKIIHGSGAKAYWPTIKETNKLVGEVEETVKRIKEEIKIAQQNNIESMNSLYSIIDGLNLF